jgi:hypothetical protein
VVVGVMNLTDPTIIAAIERALADGQDSCAFTVPGDGSYSDNPEPFGKVWEAVPPAEWVALAGPCETCHADGSPTRGGKSVYCKTCGGDGRKRVAFTVTCPHPAEPRERSFCSKCWTTNGVVPVVSAAVTVQANDDGQTYTVMLEGMVKP